MSSTLRNVLIVVALAAAVAFVPGGGRTADFVNAVLSIGIGVVITLLVVRFYRERRMTIYALGDTHRGLLYGAVGAVVLALAGRTRLLETGGGTIVFFVLLGGAAAALYAVWQHHRSYGF